MTFTITVSPESAREFARLVAEEGEALRIERGDRARVLMSCDTAGKDLGISGVKVRGLVEAGHIDRVPGFSEIKISPEALEAYRRPRK